MTDEFKRWLCEKAGINKDFLCDSKSYQLSFIAILIKAMWSINREDMSKVIKMSHTAFTIENLDNNGKVKYYNLFSFYDHNNSEQEALQKALEYIYEKE